MSTVYFVPQAWEAGEPIAAALRLNSWVRGHMAPVTFTKVASHAYRLFYPLLSPGSQMGNTGSPSLAGS